MRKHKILVVMAIALSAILPVYVSASNEIVPDSIVTTEMVNTEKANALTARLEAINAIDKSDMTRTEKKALRKEVRTIKKELKAIGSGGVYLSVGAILLVVILLIILL
jgi:malate/lactate dehydrogenase